MNIEYVERKNRIKELSQKLRENKENINLSMEIWEEIMNIDMYGEFLREYKDAFEYLSNAIDKKSPQFIKLWNISSIEIKTNYEDLFEDVLKFAISNPDDCLNIWNNAHYNGKVRMIHYTGIIENVLKQTYENINEKEKLRTLQMIFNYSGILLHRIDSKLIADALEYFTAKDAVLALYVYKNVKEEQKAEMRSYVDTEVLNATIEKEIEEEKSANALGKLYNSIIESGIPGLDAEKYKERIEQYYLENPRETLSDLQNYSYADSKQFNHTIIEILGILQQSGEDISNYKQSFTLSAKALETLVRKVGIDGIPKGIELNIELESIAGLSTETLLKMGGRIKEFYIGNSEAYKKYSYDEIKATKLVIDDFLKDIDRGDENDPNREKKIFEKVIKKLAKHIKYDYETVRKEKQESKLRKKLNAEKLSEEEKKRIESKIKSLNIETKSRNSRNLIGGLLNGKSVCSGYADIVRNVFACLRNRIKKNNWLSTKRCTDMHGIK